MIPASTTLSLGHGFWNIRSDDESGWCCGLRSKGGHMSIIQHNPTSPTSTTTSLTPLTATHLRYVIVDVIDLAPCDKDYLDYLTDGGRHIEADLVTSSPLRPETLTKFHSTYSNANYFGIPGCLRDVPSIQWSGDLSRGSASLSLFESQVRGGESASENPPRYPGQTPYRCERGRRGRSHG